jgi:hypothetical protein
LDWYGCSPRELENSICSTALFDGRTPETFTMAGPALLVLCRFEGARARFVSVPLLAAASRGGEMRRLFVLEVETAIGSSGPLLVSKKSERISTSARLTASARVAPDGRWASRLKDALTGLSGLLESYRGRGAVILAVGLSTCCGGGLEESRSITSGAMTGDF